jgi:protease-4
MKKRAILLFISLMALSLALSGCTLVNISVAPKEKPLEEKVLEGEGKQKILLLDLDGTISFKEESGRLGIGKKPSKVSFFREALRKAENDTDVAGVILRINSPGGTVAASDTIYHEVMRFREKRKVPVHAYIMELGASGGYYVASAADRIVASPAAITGSIGVIAVKLNIEGLLTKIGVSDETYKSGPKKDFWLPFHPSTPEEKEMLQGVIDRLYGRFLEVVYRSRHKVLTEAEVRALADGRIMTADEALKAKLIDEVAYLEDEIGSMKKSLGIEKAKVVTYARPAAFRPDIYSGAPFQGPQVINLISINADELLPSGVRFMYLWNP